MTIGIDLSVLQTPHRMRGIGYTVINFINNLPEKAKADNDFVFYMHDTDDEGDPLEILDLTDINYSVVVMRQPNPSLKNFDQSLRQKHVHVPGRLRSLVAKINRRSLKLRYLLLGDRRVPDWNGIDAFIQFDQNQSLPAKHKVRSILVLYDVIPYVMESDYLWSYTTARQHGQSVISAFRTHLRRKQYIWMLRLRARQASQLLAISAHTRDDMVRYVGLSKSKIAVCHLGVTEPKQHSIKNLDFRYYRPSSWGYLSQPVSIEGKKYLLFVGGADPRRKLIDLLAAFNNLRARGHDVYLILTGDTMKGPLTIPNEKLQAYFNDSPYLDSVYFMGFVTDAQREYLYKHALAFVYPSTYEGFGLPILEAMNYGTPVITYNNSSIGEVAGKAALYVSDHAGIVAEATRLLSTPSLSETYAKAGLEQVKRFSWEKTSKEIIDHATSLR